MPLFIGIDVGTSACRACAIDARGRIAGEARTDLPPPARTPAGIEQAPAIWWQALTTTLDHLCTQIDTGAIARLAVDGTSSTLLLAAPDGTALTPGLMYNDARATVAARLIEQHAPPDSAARGPSSSLAKCLHLAAGRTRDAWLALHQADWLAGSLTGNFRYSDENNALKMGYDLEQGRWPDWFGALPLDPARLPEVVPPGTVIGTLRPALADHWRCRRDVTVVAGTTDSTAGFIAAGARRAGTAVSALGSTLVLKVLSDRPVFSAGHGVYSHRLGGRWLAGGASNAGGAVLQTLFGRCDIKRYSRLMQPAVATGLDYYPLLSKGERFPVQDPDLAPRLTPRPASDAVFFQAILESLAGIEQRGYRLLAELGAPYPARVLSVGGGAANLAWQEIRHRRLGVPVGRAPHQEAAYGAALLALRGQAVFPDP